MLPESLKTMFESVESTHKLIQFRSTLIESYYRVAIFVFTARNRETGIIESFVIAFEPYSLFGEYNYRKRYLYARTLLHLVSDGSIQLTKVDD